MYNIQQQIREEFYAGQQEIGQASLDGRLSSQQQVDAHALWRTITFLKTKMEEEPVCLDEIGPQDIMRWIK
jgi:hypothetical protein